MRTVLPQLLSNTTVEPAAANQASGHGNESGVVQIIIYIWSRYKHISVCTEKYSVTEILRESNGNGTQSMRVMKLNMKMEMRILGKRGQSSA